MTFVGYIRQNRLILMRFQLIFNLLGYVKYRFQVSKFPLVLGL